MWRSDANRYVIAEIDPQPGTRLLDIGAGMGAGVVAAVERGAIVTAVDPTPYMRLILNVRRLWPGRGRAVTVLDGTAERLPVGDRSVDAIVAVNTMHHWQDLGAAAAEIARVLVAGGRALLVDEDFDHPDHELADRFADRRHQREEHGIEAVAGAAVEEALTAAGLVDVEVVNTAVKPTIPILRASATKS